MDKNDNTNNIPKTCPICGAPTRNQTTNESTSKESEELIDSVAYWCGSYFRSNGSIIGGLQDCFEFMQSHQCIIYQVCKSMEQYGRPNILRGVKWSILPI